MSAETIVHEIINRGGVAHAAAYTGVAVSTYSIFGHTLQEWVYVATLLALVFGMLCTAIKTRAITKAAKISLKEAEKAERGSNDQS